MSSKYLSGRKVVPYEAKGKDNGVHAEIGGSRGINSHHRRHDYLPRNDSIGFKRPTPQRDMAGRHHHEPIDYHIDRVVKNKDAL